MRIGKQQFSFTAMQLDPELAARKDIKAYYAGGLDLTNTFGLPQGGAAQRGGMSYAAEVAPAVNGCRIAKFEKSTEQAYLIVFTALEIRVFMEGVLQATVPSPYPAGELEELDWTQSLDTMIIVHPHHAPRKLVRQGAHTNWGLNILTLTDLPTYEFGINWPELAITPGAASGSGIAVNGTSAWFMAGDIGATISGNGGVATVVGVGSDTQITVDITTSFADTSQIGAGDWSFDMATATTKTEDTWNDRRGWPRSVYLFEGRLYFGGSKERPQTDWGSTSDDFFSFKTTIAQLANEAVELTMDNDRVSAIEHMYALDDMFLFTSGGLFVVGNTPITPENFAAKRHSEVPAAKVRVVELDGSVAFVNRAMKVGQHQSVHELVFDDTRQLYVTQDLAQLVASLLKGPVDMAVRLGNESSSANHLFVINSDGTAAVLNTRRSQQIAGWSPLVTSGKLKATAVVLNTAWFMVERTVNGASRFYLESLDANRVLDSSLSLTSGTPTMAWSGLDHLEGEVVSLVGDGVLMGEATVTSGAITTPVAVSSLEVGLLFNCAVETMPIEAQLANGTLVGNSHRIVKSSVHVHQTKGPISINGREKVFEVVGSSLLDQPAPPYSGVVNMRHRGWSTGRKGQGQTSRVTWPSTSLGTILSITAEVAA